MKIKLEDKVYDLEVKGELPPEVKGFRKFFRGVAGRRFLGETPEEYLARVFKKSNYKKQFLSNGKIVAWEDISQFPFIKKGTELEFRVIEDEGRETLVYEGYRDNMPQRKRDKGISVVREDLPKLRKRKWSGVKSFGKLFALLGSAYLAFCAMPLYHTKKFPVNRKKRSLMVAYKTIVNMDDLGKEIIDWDRLNWDENNFGVNEKKAKEIRVYLEKMRQLFEIAEGVNTESRTDLRIPKGREPQIIKEIIDSEVYTIRNLLESKGIESRIKNSRELVFPREALELFNEGFYIVRVPADFYGNSDRKAELRYGNCIFHREDSGLEELAHEEWEMIYKKWPPLSKRKTIKNRIWEEIINAKFKAREEIRGIERTLGMSFGYANKMLGDKKSRELCKQATKIWGFTFKHHIKYHDNTPAEILRKYFSVKSMRISDVKGYFEGIKKEDLIAQTIDLDIRSQKILQQILDQELGRGWDQGWAPLRKNQFKGVIDYNPNNAWYFIKRRAMFPFREAWKSIPYTWRELSDQAQLCYMDQKQKFGWLKEDNPLAYYGTIAGGQIAMAGAIIGFGVYIGNRIRKRKPTSPQK